MKNLKLRSLFLAAVSLMVGGCASAPTGPVFSQFQTMHTGEREALVTETEELIEVKKSFDEIQTKRLTAGLPVNDEIGNVKVIKKWDQQTTRLSIYEGHTTGAFGHDSLLIMTVLTHDDSPKPVRTINIQTGVPEFSVFAGNVSVDSTMYRKVVEGLSNVPAAAFNGAIAAEIQNCDGCRGGGAGVVNLVNASAGSQSGSSASAEVGISGNGSYAMPKKH